MPNTDKLLKQNNAVFKRYTGIHKATFYEMLEAMQQHETQKTKSGRPRVLSLGEQEQILLALTYWREYRTLYHISMDFGIHESSASRIIRKVEYVLINSGKFELPRKLPSRVDDDINWSVVIVDATETPIERPKKTKETTIAARRNNTP
ncbi:transposase family protein [Psychrobacter sp. ANT_H3]|uniref:transposase family protein n=1 Tax=Psychrobacter sp. ANT_H3 TaxID=3019444 RepID=UPI0022F1A147|nr:transposase family protein [Psychrobacter sp. ANT_H3]MDA5134635.1 transposase family protein [Psychrobacter sp. ANT_H3]